MSRLGAPQGDSTQICTLRLEIKRTLLRTTITKLDCAIVKNAPVFAVPKNGVPGSLLNDLYGRQQRIPEGFDSNLFCTGSFESKQQNGFFCDDTSIRYPKRDESIPNYLLCKILAAVSITIISVVETLFNIINQSKHI